jgi:hypothetical protein
MALAILSIVANPAMAQEMQDLTALADATWVAATGTASGPDLIASAAEASALRLAFEDRSEWQLPPEWRDLARVEVGWSRRHSPLDRVECAILSEAGIARLLAVLERHGDRYFDHLPDVLHPFAGDSPRAMLEDGAITSARSCLGSYQVRPDEIDLQAWQTWYDKLQVRFEGAGLTILRRPPGTEAFPVGFLSGRGPVCHDRVCVALAAPFNVVMQGVGGQVTLNVIAGIRP